MSVRCGRGCGVVCMQKAKEKKVWGDVVGHGAKEPRIVWATANSGM